MWKSSTAGGFPAASTALPHLAGTLVPARSGRHGRSVWCGHAEFASIMIPPFVLETENGLCAGPPKGSSPGARTFSGCGRTSSAHHVRCAHGKWRRTISCGDRSPMRATLCPLASRSRVSSPQRSAAPAQCLRRSTWRRSAWPLFQRWGTWWGPPRTTPVPGL